jgi:hypothetical protein
MGHVHEVVRSSVEETLNALLDTEADERGGSGFSDRGISGFRAGHSRRNEVHEEAQM